MSTHPARPGTTTSFYGKVDDSQRAALLQSYLDYLLSRNGQLDPKTGRLPLREAGLQEMNASPVHYAGHIAQADFDRHYARLMPGAPELTPELLLLLTFCKMNAGEAYGVRVVRAVHERRQKGSPDLRGRVIQFAQEEEEYHTRILVGATHHFNVQATEAYTPSPVLRLLIGSIAYAPRPLFHPILYASEVAGVFVFSWTLKRVGEVLTGQPELREALEQRLIEILIDEIGHVAFNRLVMGKRGRGLGARLAPQVVRGLPSITPELGALGFDRSAQRAFAGFDLANLPEQVRRCGFFA